MWAGTWSRTGRRRSHYIEARPAVLDCGRHGAEAALEADRVRGDQGPVFYQTKPNMQKKEPEGLKTYG